MAKSYIDIVKYMVEARFEISGSVEKPDIIGAVFGQTEGLLGGDLDLRELQKNGKIGRIEIESSTSGNRTFGKLFLPSSMGRVETCILSAAIESVDRVGPFETRFQVLKIEDTRNEKRRKIIARAKELVKNLLVTEIPDSREISDLVEADVKTSTVGTYGSDNLPAGPEIEKSDDLVLVEGRADVINLLKNDIANCVAVGGAAGTIPKTIIDLCTAKETTLFVDGDRGGEMIVRNITSVADVDFVARAPDGKEVEELTRKEIIKALRSRVPIEQVNAAAKQRQEQQARREDRFRDRREHRPPAQETTAREVLSPTEITANLQRAQAHQRRAVEGEATGAPSSLGIKDISGEGEPEGIESIAQIEGMEAQRTQAGAPNQTLVKALNELKNTLRGRVYSNEGVVLSEVPIRELIQSVQDMKNVGAVVFDGIITQRLVDLAHERSIKEVYGLRASQITRRYPDLMLYTAEHG
ncbi:MAG: DNA primase DnaG [Candidatus Marsarchaeota archaeon]|jgi:DNA primase|nr:DNA primase DnaG [Candidatus Marsarchaeota archaeon]MCL5111882.1 DNA primase DnaG [Candidatus Marsarchaeota archaeon]